MFWLVYYEVGCYPVLDSCCKSIIHKPVVGWDPGLDSRYKWIVLNILTGITWGWVKPSTWLMLQVNYIDSLTDIPWGWVRPWTWLMLQIDYIDYYDVGWDSGLECFQCLNVLTGMSWGWVTPWTWLMLQVTWIEYLNFKTLELGDTLYLTHFT